MEPADLPAVLDGQEAGGVLGLAEVFPQDRYPFPRQAIHARWLQEIESPDIDCQVVVVGGTVVGFVAIRGDELLHFGIAPEHWGSGVARAAHDAALARMTAAGIERAWLAVFTANRRGRRFYERLGWRPTDVTTRSTYPPHAELRRYERDLLETEAGATRQSPPASQAEAVECPPKALG